ncbi:MAG: hypothetical protein QXH42_07390 [Thermoplasmata archaeon]
MSEQSELIEAREKPERNARRFLPGSKLHYGPMPVVKEKSVALH